MTISKEIMFAAPLKTLNGTVTTIEKPFEGALCLDHDTGRLMVYAGSEWKIVGEKDTLRDSVEAIENEKFKNGYIR